jgi:hypothetical protein
MPLSGCGRVWVGYGCAVRVTLREDPPFYPLTHPRPQNLKSQSSLLNQRWDKVRAVPDTLNTHYDKSLSLYNVEVKSFAKSKGEETDFLISNIFLISGDFQ